MSLSIFTTSGFSDIYALIQGTGIAVPMTEGTGMDAGWYFVDEADLVTAELPAGTYAGVFLHGDWENANPADPPEGTFDGFVWNGEDEVDQLADIKTITNQTNGFVADPTNGLTAIKTAASAIKAKTDNLPASPAAVSNIPTAAQNASAVRTELTTELGRVDAAISTRLASGSYTAPPSAATNASAVRTELATELARVDAAVSTRLATSSYTAPPSASTNASAVRTELATELARVDAAVSTRLATSSYTTPPTASTVANAVAAQTSIATALTTIATNLDGKVSEIEVGSGGTTIPVSQIPIPNDRLWVLKS